jgi:hypothetical protein
MERERLYCLVWVAPVSKSPSASTSLECGTGERLFAGAVFVLPRVSGLKLESRPDISGPFKTGVTTDRRLLRLLNLSIRLDSVRRGGLGIGAHVHLFVRRRFGDHLLIVRGIQIR